MAKQKAWQETIGGVSHSFTLDTGRREYVLSVDGTVCLTARTTWTGALTGYDLPFQLDGHELRIAIPANGRNVDIVEDGHYLSTGKAYVPMPKWIWAFLIPIIPLAFLGGAIGALLGVIGFGICSWVAKSSINIAARFLLCLVITAASWGVYYLVANMFLDVTNKLF